MNRNSTLPGSATKRIGACYIRVSTDDQLELSPESQRDELLKYADNNSIVIPEEYIFLEEKGRSGKRSVNRPKFQSMIGLAKSARPPFEVILVWKYSRFARNQEESILYKSLLKKHGVELISITEPLIEGPFGELIERIIEWMDEYYSIRLAGDVIRGMTKKALLGGYQAAAPFGYSLENKKLCPNKDAAIVRHIFSLYLSGEGIFRIAQRLNELQLTTYRGSMFECRSVRYIIQNPVYKGYVRWNNQGGSTALHKGTRSDSECIISKGTHEPIVSEEVWLQANDRLLSEYRRPYSKPSTMLRHWLSGLLFCDSCSSVLVSGGSNGGFQCNGYTKGKCSVSHYISYKLVEQTVMKALYELSKDCRQIYEVIPSEEELGPEILAEVALQKLEFKKIRIKEAYINGIDTLEEYKKNKQKLEDEKTQLINSKVSLSDRCDSKQPSLEVITSMENLYSVIGSNAEISIKNTAMKSIVKQMLYSKCTGNIDITFYYS